MPPKRPKKEIGIKIQEAYKILTNDDEVCIPSLFSILLAAYCVERDYNMYYIP